MNTQKTTTNLELTQKELRVAFKECYLEIQRALLKMIYKSEDEQERKKWCNLMKETGENYKKAMDKL